jgi:CRISPR-associated protein Cas1
MATLYLLRQNTVLRKRGNRLLFCLKRARKTTTLVQEDEILLDIPCTDVDHVMVFGNIQLTTQAMNKLLSQGVECALFSHDGDLIGQLTPPHGKNVFLRQKQFECFQDEEFRLTVARIIVQMKIKSQIDNVKRYRHHHADTFKAADWQFLKNDLAKSEKATRLSELLGIEGSASSGYFTLLGKMLPKPWTFPSRSRRPPMDAPNAILSYGYTIVASELQSLLDGRGLDPYFGFYHELSYGRPSLALDLLEPFRHLYIDRMMVNLFSLGSMKESDFAAQPRGGIYLSQSGKEKFFKQYEQVMGSHEGASQEAGQKSKGRSVMASLIKDTVHAVEKRDPDLFGIAFSSQHH